MLTDQFEGGVSEDKAMTDITRGVIMNLKHECVGYWASATIKKVSILNSLTGVGVIALDRIKRLFWKNYKPIAEGEDVIVPTRWERRHYSNTYFHYVVCSARTT